MSLLPRTTLHSDSEQVDCKTQPIVRVYMGSCHTYLEKGRQVGLFKGQTGIKQTETQIDKWKYRQRDTQDYRDEEKYANDPNKHVKCVQTRV